MKVWLPRNAKRLAALTLTLVLVLALAACGAQTDEPAATATPAVEPPAIATPTPAATAQSGQSGAATGAQALTDVLADIAKNVQVGAAGSSFLPVTVVSSSVSSRGSVTLPCWPGSPSPEMASRPRPANT